MFDGIPYFSEALYIFLRSFSFCCSYWILHIDLSSSLLILSSATSDVLLNILSEFLISVIILLKTRIYTHITYLYTHYTHILYIIIYFCIDVHCLVRVLLLSFSYLDMVSFGSLNKFITADLKFFSAKSSIWTSLGTDSNFFLSLLFLCVSWISFKWHFE